MISNGFPGLKFSILSIVSLFSLFAFGLVWYTLDSYQQLSLVEQDKSIHKKLKINALERKSALFSRQEVFANSIKDDRRLVDAIAKKDIYNLRILLQQYLASAQLAVNSILIRGPDAQIITGEYDEVSEPYNGCPVIIDSLAKGNKVARQKSKYALCTVNGQPMSEVVVATVAAETEIYIHVIAHLKNELASLGKASEMPVSISGSPDSLLYQSADWVEVKLTEGMSKPVSYTLFGDDNVPAAVISTIYNRSQLKQQLNLYRDTVLHSAGLITAIAFLLVLISLLYVFRSIDLLKNSLGKVEKDSFVPVQKARLPVEFYAIADAYNKMITVLEDSAEKGMIAQKDLRSERDFLSKTLSSITNSVVVLNSDLIITQVNPAFETLLDEKQENLVGYSFSEIIILYVNRSVTHIADLAQLLKNPTQIFRLYYQKDGEVLELEMMVSPMLDMDSEDIGFVLFFKDVTESNILRRKLNYESSHDKLTGLLNQLSFESKFDDMISDVYVSKSHHVLVNLNIDDFKVISQSCGGDAGNLLIKQVSETLSHSVRKSDLVSRLGGNEFGLILAYADIGVAADTVSAVLANICKAGFRWNDVEYPVTASAAMISFGEISDEFSEVLHSLTNACTLAKQKGGNQYYLVGDNDVKVKEHHENLSWVARINKGFSQNRFKLYVQPIVSVQSGVEKPFYEVLIRYIDEDNEIILPREFLGAAERFNLIEKIDRWVVSEVTHWLAVNQELKQDIQFSINISERSISSDSFNRFLNHLFQTDLVDGNHFCFETTDKTVSKDVEKSFEFIKKINQLGAKFTLDNFGSGLFSLAHLKNISAEYLKIDGQIINDLLKDGHSSVIARSITEVAHSLGMKVIAESVESTDLLQKLSEAKVDFLQGEAIGEPLPIESIDVNREWTIGNH